MAPHLHIMTSAALIGLPYCVPVFLRATLSHLLDSQTMSARSHAMLSKARLQYC